MGIRWLGCKGGISPGKLIRYLWGSNSMSRLIHCMIFVVDLTACWLIFFIRACSVCKAVEWVPCVAAVNGA